jgi:ketose-bisphosphate aldolase
MPIVNMDAMLKKALKEGYAVGAYNILDFTSLNATIMAAEETNAPVIIQTSPKTVKFWGLETVAGWFKLLAHKSPVPVALHLDHCKDIALIQACVDAGWTSVMIDASSFPFEKNMAMTAEVLAYATPRGVSVEAELGEIGGVEDDLVVQDEDAHLVDPQKAQRFCAELGLHCFAPAIGTAHGVYKGEPKIAFDRLAEVAQLTAMPLALHGGTGLSEAVFTRCIASGCAKVNISTQLKYGFIDSFVNYFNAHPAEYNPLTILDAQQKAIKAIVIENNTIFGSVGKA